MSLEEGEALAANGATAPRISLDDLKARVVGEFYFNGGDPMVATICPPDVRIALNCLTVCILVLDNGWTLVGKSAPASPANFDSEKGHTFAYEDALRQLWPLEGYRLRNQLWAVEQPPEYTGDDDGE